MYLCSFIFLFDWPIENTCSSHRIMILCYLLVLLVHFRQYYRGLRLAFLDIEVGGTDLFYKNVKKEIDDKNLKQWKIMK
jgi:hypothetical protein